MSDASAEDAEWEALKQAAERIRQRQLAQQMREAVQSLRESRFAEAIDAQSRVQADLREILGNESGPGPQAESRNSDSAAQALDGDRSGESRAIDLVAEVREILMLQTVLGDEVEAAASHRIEQLELEALIDRQSRIRAQVSGLALKSETQEWFAGLIAEDMLRAEAALARQRFEPEATGFSRNATEKLEQLRSFLVEELARSTALQPGTEGDTSEGDEESSGANENSSPQLADFRLLRLLQQRINEETKSVLKAGNGERLKILSQEQRQVMHEFERLLEGLGNGN